MICRVVHGQPSLDRVPAQVRPLAERCLAKDPGDRPTAGELLAELSDGRSWARAVSGNPARTWPVLARLPGCARSGARSGGTFVSASSKEMSSRPSARVEACLAIPVMQAPKGVEVTEA